MGLDPQGGVFGTMLSELSLRFPQIFINFPQMFINFPQIFINFPQIFVNFPQIFINFLQIFINFPQIFIWYEKLWKNNTRWLKWDPDVWIPRLFDGIPRLQKKHALWQMFTKKRTGKIHQFWWVTIDQMGFYGGVMVVLWDLIGFTLW